MVFDVWRFFHVENRKGFITRGSLRGVIFQLPGRFHLLISGMVLRGSNQLWICLNLCSDDNWTHEMLGSWFVILISEMFVQDTLVEMQFPLLNLVQQFTDPQISPPNSFQLLIQHQKPQLNLGLQHQSPQRVPQRNPRRRSQETWIIEEPHQRIRTLESQSIIHKS